MMVFNCEDGENAGGIGYVGPTLSITCRNRNAGDIEDNAITGRGIGCLKGEGGVGKVFADEGTSCQFLVIVDSSVDGSYAVIHLDDVFSRVLVGDGGSDFFTWCHGTGGKGQLIKDGRLCTGSEIVVIA